MTVENVMRSGLIQLLRQNLLGLVQCRHIHNRQFSNSIRIAGSRSRSHDVHHPRIRYQNHRGAWECCLSHIELCDYRQRIPKFSGHNLRNTRDLLRFGTDRRSNGEFLDFKTQSQQTQSVALSLPFVSIPFVSLSK